MHVWAETKHSYTYNILASLDKCQAHLDAFQDDGLDKLVSALPPSFTSRFGEVCWAQGGVGFGWWPSFIYDPRLTVGNARQLARKNLGKRHLVYFFECHEAPFAVLTNSKITAWEKGLLEDYHLGKAAKGAGRLRTVLFEQALQAATLELSKPIEMRLDWNHTEQPQVLPSPKPILPKRRSVTNANRHSTSNTSTANNSNNNSNSIPDHKGDKKRPRESGDQSSIEGAAANRSSTSFQEGRRRVRNATSSGRRPRRGGSGFDLLSSASSAAEGEKDMLAHTLTSEPQMSTRRNLIHAMEELATMATMSATQIESSEDGELYCKLLQRILPLDGSAVPARATTPTKSTPSSASSESSVVNIGFVKLPSRKKSTFAHARTVIQQELVPDVLSPTADWKFYVPSLGPVSSRQEESLGPMLPFLQNATSDPRLGNGSLRNPLKVIIVDSPKTIGMVVFGSANTSQQEAGKVAATPNQQPALGKEK